MEGGREKLTARSGVARSAGGGSQTPERETGHLYAEANNRRITKKATIDGKDFVQKAMDVPAKSEAEEQVFADGGGS